MIRPQTILIVCVACASVAAGQGIEAITKPSDDVTLSFVRSGLVDKVLSKEGQAVAAGEVMVQQNDTAERVQLEQLKAQADDDTKVRAAKAELDQKKLDLKKFQGASTRGAATELEVQHAQLDVLIAQLSLELAGFQHAQDRRKYEEMRLMLERMRIVSPIEGKVEKLFVRSGESADALAKMVRVVKIDPLWIEVPVPLEDARALKLDQAVRVEFPEAGPVAGKVTHIAAVADAASGTLIIRVEAPNRSGRPAGEHVRVVLSGAQK